MEKVMLLVLLLAAPVFAQTGPELFKAGNASYAEGKFSDAAGKYEEALATGLRHWALEYNAGNAYFRQGQVGKAVLHYERAFRLKPGQRDVLYNLALATAKAGDPRLPSTGLAILAWKFFYFFSLNTLTLWSSGLFMILVTAMGLQLMGKKTISGTVFLGLGGFFIVTGVWLGARIYVAEQPRGIVVSSVAEVRSGPSTTYPANFTVPEGQHVLILEEQELVQDWHQIGVPREGLRGWVPAASVEMI